MQLDSDKLFICANRIHTHYSTVRTHIAPDRTHTHTPRVVCTVGMRRELFAARGSCHDCFAQRSIVLPVVCIAHIHCACSSQQYNRLSLLSSPPGCVATQKTRVLLRSGFSQCYALFQLRFDSAGCTAERVKGKGRGVREHFNMFYRKSCSALLFVSIMLCAFQYTNLCWVRARPG